MEFTKMKVYEKFLSIIERVQYTSTAHMQCAIQLKHLYHESDEDEFFDSLKKYMNHFLLMDFKYTNRQCERSIEFISTFVAETMGPENLDTDKNDPDDSVMETAFQTKVFNYLLDVQNMDDKILRFRACQILTNLFGLMIENSLSTEMCDKLESALIERFSDCCLAVRLQAANCLYHLQDPRDPSNPVLQVYFDRAYYDPSAKIRSICIEKIAMRKDILKSLVNFIRDIDASVRLTAFKRLSKAFPKHLEIVDRQTVILSVLTDNCQRNIDFVSTKLIPKWLEKYNGKYFDLFAAFRLDSTVADMKNTCRIMKFITKSLFDLHPIRDLIDGLNLNNDNCIPLQSLSWDSVLFWRCLIDLVHEKSKNDESYDQVLHELLVPELMKFIKYVQDYIETNGMLLNIPPDHPPFKNPYSEQAPIDERQFIVRQLFMITHVFADDFSDIVIRRTFNSLISDSLKRWSFDMETIQTMVTKLESSIPIVNDRVTFVCELIAEICEPTIPNVSDSDMFKVPVTPNEIANEIEENTANSLSISQNGAQLLNGQDYSFQLAQLKLDLYRLSNRIEVAISESDYLGANEYKIGKEKVRDKIQELELLMNPTIPDPEPDLDEDPIMALFSQSSPSKGCDTATAVPPLSTLTICQVLDIAGGLLIQGRVIHFSPVLDSLHKNVIARYLIHDDATVKVRALRCLAQCCILSKKLAKSFVWMFTSPIQEYKPSETSISEPQIMAVFMSATCDLLRIHGTDLISDANASLAEDITEDLHRSPIVCSPLSTVVQGLVRIMENESGELQYVTVIVLCMLVDSGIIRSSNVLCRLLLIWCLPSSAYDDEYGEWCKQYVGILMQNFRLLKSAPEMVQNAFLPTLKTLINAPKTSPHSEVKLERIVKFILELALTVEMNGTIHDSWAISICTHLRNKPTIADVPCGKRQSSATFRDGKIVGGQEAAPGEFPWLVSLTKRGGHFCGGTMINKKYVLTAAHCICSGLGDDFIDPIHIRLTLAQHDLTLASSQTYEVSVATIIPHQGYRCSKVKNDIALLELTSEVQWSEMVSPACLPLGSSDFGYQVAQNQIATVAGWGWVDENRQKGRAKVLQKAKVEVLENGKCRQWYKSQGKKTKIQDSQLCAGFEQGGVDACWADSGGPLVLYDSESESTVIGIVSTGIGCARPYLPGLYTRISEFIPWIQATINNRKLP